MNLAVGGNWPGDPNASTLFPANLKVDYIRVYNTAGPTLTENNTAVTAVVNSSASNTGSFSDSSAVTITASVGSVTQTTGTSGTWSWSGTPNGSGPYTVTITATDAGNSTSTTSFSVSFTDPLLTVSTTSSPTSVPENATASARRHVRR